jgi:hypothetical protein
MRFSMLLFVLYQKLKRATRKNATFRSHINTMNAKILIKTEDGKRGRLFVFQRGRLSSVRGGTHSDFDVALVWSDAKTAFRVMASRSDEDSFRAAAEGKLRVEGMAVYAQWFTEGVKLIL